MDEGNWLGSLDIHLDLFTVEKKEGIADILVELHLV
jgi:hypothetical protein